MKKLVLLFLPLVVADLYKETQDFQYRRTSDNEEQKGFYSSQSGNMGGNYEIAHNMDNLAQRQMKGLVDQVGSQLGVDPSNIGLGRDQRRLYGSASVSGTSFGNVNSYDRSGANADRYVNQRNYQEGAAARASGSSYRNSNTYQQSGASADRYLQGGATGDDYRSYNSQEDSRYGDRGTYTSGIQNSRLYTAGTNGVRESSKAEEASYTSGSQTKYTTTALGHESELESDTRRRVIETRPGTTVKLYVRPGQTIPISVPVQSSAVSTSQSAYERNVQVQQPRPNIRLVAVPVDTYGVNKGSSSVYEQRNQQQYYNQGSRVDGYGGHLDTQQVVKPTYNQLGETNKNYEESYSARRLEEKSSVSSGGHQQAVSYDNDRYQSGQGATPLAPVVDLSGAAQNRDKFLVGVLGVGDEGQSTTTFNSGSRVASTGRQYSGQTYQQAAGNQGRYNTDYARRIQSGSNSEDLAAMSHNYDGTRNLQASGTNFQLAGRSGGVEETTPKSFHSSYSYHKSWERRGDPYIILPDGTTQVIKDTEQSENTNSRSQTGSSQLDMTAEMERMKQRLRSEMETNMCTTDCNKPTTKSSGYSASYQYSAQRQYGNQGQTYDNDKRYKRAVGSNVGNNNLQVENFGPTSYEENEDVGQRVIDHSHLFNKPYAEHTDHAQIRMSDNNNRPTGRQINVYDHQKPEKFVENYDQQTADLGQQVVYNDFNLDFNKPKEQYTSSRGIINQHQIRERRGSGYSDQRNYDQQSEDLGQQTMSEDYGQQTIGHGYSGRLSQTGGSQTARAFINRQNPYSERENFDQQEDVGQHTADQRGENLEQQRENGHYDRQTVHREQGTFSGFDKPSSRQYQIVRGSQTGSGNSQRNLGHSSVNDYDRDVFNHLEDLKKTIEEENNNKNKKIDSPLDGYRENIDDLHIRPEPSSHTSNPSGGRSFLDTYYPHRTEITTTTTSRYSKPAVHDYNDQEVEDFGQKAEDLGQQVQDIHQSSFDVQQSRSTIGNSNMKVNQNFATVTTSTTQAPGLWTRTKEKVGSWFG